MAGVEFTQTSTNNRIGKARNFVLSLVAASLVLAACNAPAQSPVAIQATTQASTEPTEAFPAPAAGGYAPIQPGDPFDYTVSILLDPAFRDQPLDYELFAVSAAAEP